MSGPTRERPAPGYTPFASILRTEQLNRWGLVADIRDTSFLALHPNKKYLYAVTESDDFDAQGSGSVSAFAISPETGRLRKLNEVSSRGGWPCHLSVDGSGRMLIVANYKGGSVASFPVNQDGTLGRAVSFFQHEGSSVHSRQQQPHAHSADFSADGQFAFFSDLGLDQVKVYRANAETATLAPHEPSHVKVAPGSGPRHFAQHPKAGFAYGLNELSSTVSVYRVDDSGGDCRWFKLFPHCPTDSMVKNYTAEIFVHPEGKFVYASNRGHHSIAAFRIDGTAGVLEPIGQSRQGGNGRAISLSTRQGVTCWRRTRTATTYRCCGST